MPSNLTKGECQQIAEILKRRANEIADFSGKYRSGDDHYGSVELALTREVNRLRQLAVRVDPPEPENDHD